jgi:hypothetical protein
LVGGDQSEYLARAAGYRLIRLSPAIDNIVASCGLLKRSSLISVS